MSDPHANSISPIPPSRSYAKDTKVDKAVIEEKPGFLPIETNWFDRFFISVVIWIAVSLLWFRLLEPAGFSIWISNAIVFGLAIVIIKKG